MSVIWDGLRVLSPHRRTVFLSRSYEPPLQPTSSSGSKESRRNRRSPPELTHAQKRLLPSFEAELEGLPHQKHVAGQNCWILHLNLNMLTVKEV